MVSKTVASPHAASRKSTEITEITRKPAKAVPAAVTAQPVEKVEVAEQPPEPFVFNIPTVDLRLSSHRVEISRSTLPQLSASSAGDMIAGLEHAAQGLAHTIADVPARVREGLPPRDKLLFYGGLAALAGVGLVGWPTAAAIGTGVWIATRHNTTPAAPAEKQPDKPVS